jgi:3-hydroxybutyryl-CoA dehydrogenase
VSTTENSARGLQSIAIIGAGTAGRAFALACAQAGFRVVLEDVMPEKLRRAQDEYGAVAGELAGSLRYAMTVEDAVADADIAIDFVPDELESKLEIFSLLDRMAPPRTILCTPTNALSITDLASCTYRSERCVGLRGPSLLADEVELMRSKFLSAEVEAAVVVLWGRLGLAISVVADVEPMLVKNLPR